MESLSLNRRHLLQGLTTAGVSFSLLAMSSRAAQRRGAERPRSLIVLWMNGGMSQLETWDPHPGTPSGGEVTDIVTTTPDLKISSLMPQMAEQMHECLLIRSLTSKEGDHEAGAAFVRTGYRPEPTLKYPTLGAIIAHELPQPALQLPPYVILTPRIPVPEGGYLGNEWNGFRVFQPGSGVSNLNSGVSDTRQTRRLEGLDLVSRQFLRQQGVAAREVLQQDTMGRALQMMKSEQRKAFQLDEEPEALQAAYGRTEFGRGCMVARRLIETGVRVVEVMLPGFDTHIANHEGHVTQCGILDPAMATLLSDLRQRDLLQSTIVLCISEFGRTPRINPAGGRDHWPNWFSCVVAGGGFRRGAVIGATPAEEKTKRGQVSISKMRPDPLLPSKPENPVSIPELYATILTLMGIDGRKEIITPIGRPIRFVDAEPSSLLLAR